MAASPPLVLTAWRVPEFTESLRAVLGDGASELLAGRASPFSVIADARGISFGAEDGLVDLLTLPWSRIRRVRLGIVRRDSNATIAAAFALGLIGVAVNGHSGGPALCIDVVGPQAGEIRVAVEGDESVAREVEKRRPRISRPMARWVGNDWIDGASAVDY